MKEKSMSQLQSSESELKRKQKKAEADKRKKHRIIEALQELKAVTRLSLEDSVRMALNLGEMFSNVSKKTGISKREVFIKTFGERDGESLYKKRKTVMLFNDESYREAEMRKTPAKFLLLARQLIAEGGMENSRIEEQAGGLLIEGTSFDVREGPRERIHAEAWSLLQAQLREIVRNVEREIDLDWMRTFVSENHLGVVSEILGSAEMVTVGSEIVEGRYVQSVQSLDLEGVSATRSRYNNVAPCTRVANVFAEREMKVAFEIGEIDIAEPGSNCAERIRKKLAEVSGKDIFLDEWAFEDFSWWEVTDFFEKALPQGGDSSANIYFDTSIDLEILWDNDRGSWAPVMIWRDSRLPRDSEEISDDPIFFTPVVSHREEVDSIEPQQIIAIYHFEGRDRFDEPGSVYALFNPLSSSWQIFEPILYADGLYFNFSGWPGADVPILEIDGVLELGHRYAASALCSPCPVGAMRSALSRGDSPHGYTPAPLNSLCDIILSNLSYAKLEERLDQVLLKDARWKFNLLRAKAEKLDSEFRLGLERLKLREII